MRQVDAFDGVINMFLSDFWVWIHKILMNGQGDQVDAIDEGMTLEFLKIINIL